MGLMLQDKKADKRDKDRTCLSHDHDEQMMRSNHRNGGCSNQTLMQDKGPVSDRDLQLVKTDEESFSRSLLSAAAKPSA